MKKLASIIFVGCILFCQILNAQCPERTEDEWKNYFMEHSAELDAIEGLWSSNATEFIYNFYYSTDISPDIPIINEMPPSRFLGVIIKQGDNFYSCSCKRESKPDNAIYIASYSIYKKTASKNVYLRESYKDSKMVHNSNALLNNGVLLEFEFELSIDEKVEGQQNLIKKHTKNNTLTDDDYQNLLLTGEQWKIKMQRHKMIVKHKNLKVFPRGDNSFEHSSGSGTGFALTSNGYIVTNNHVVNGAKTITVKGINGNFQKAYDAKVITVDKNNDLAIIKIDDPAFKSIGKIPYVVSSKTSDAGSSVFVVGYPLRASMGDEIKLTNGIISSKSGYQGDVTTYQISAPLQPGNSGGPMFDNKGSLIGVVNAKLTGAENASYAIKTSYLLNLIETLATVPQLQTVSSLAGKPLTEQVKAVKNFTYIIEVK